jgi:hypothetical protein
MVAEMRLDECRSELAQTFYVEEEQHVRDRLRARREPGFTRQELARVCGVYDEEFLDKLSNHACPESLAMLVFAPLLAVAWADGRLSPSERGIILDAAEDFGISRGSPAFNLLGQWLAYKPTRKMREAWIAYVQELSCGLCSKDRHRLAEKLLCHARELSDLVSGAPVMAFTRRRSKRRIVQRFASAFRGSAGARKSSANNGRP